MKGRGKVNNKSTATPAKKIVLQLIERAMKGKLHQKEIEAARESYKKEISEAVIEFAYAGDVKRVDILLNKFNAGVEEALYGYARGGHDLAIEGICRNAESRGKKLSMDPVAAGYAESGKFETVVQLLKNRKVDPYLIVDAYNAGGFTEQAEQLKTSTDKARKTNALILGYEILKIANEVKDEKHPALELANAIAREDKIGKLCVAEKELYGLSKNSLCQDLRDIRKLMQRYGLDFDHGFKFNLLKNALKRELPYDKKGIKLIERSTELTRERLIEIGEKNNLSAKDVEELLPALTMKLMSSEVKLVSGLFKNGMFSTPSELREALHETETHFTSQFGLK